jgi:hypothetical protein
MEELFGGGPMKETVPKGTPFRFRWGRKMVVVSGVGSGVIRVGGHNRPALDVYRDLSETEGKGRCRALRKLLREHGWSAQASVKEPKVARREVES